MMLQVSSNGDEVRIPAPAGIRHKHRTSCECCPYGYHIDLDFVRYCEAFNKSAAHSPASKLRERRRQRQSMEVLLGLTSPTVWQLEQQLPQVPQEDEEIPPPPPPIDSIDASNASAAIFRDALHKAVLDFEETLQRSNRKLSPPDLDEFLETSPLPPESSLYYEHQPGVLRRSVSTSSLASSLSGESSVALAPTRGAHPGSAAAAQDSDVASIGSAASGVSTCALQNIREQMAKSLEKMREMEERVKVIPILQSQLVALKEEKRLMLLQLKAGEAERNKLVSLENTDATDLRQRLENLSDRGLATPRMQRKFISIGKDVIQEPLRIRDDSSVSSASRPASSNTMGNILNGGEVIPRVSMRDVGVDCSVLTRDVGVSHSSPKLRSVATQSKDVSPKSLLSFSAIRSETILPSPTATSFHSSDLNRKLDKAKAEENLLLPSSIKKEPIMKLPTIDNATNTARPDIKHASCSTDIKMNQMYTEQEVEKMIEAHGKKVSREEEALRARRRSDKAVLAKPRCSDSAVSATPRTRDAASSECTVNDLVCDKCNVRKKSIGVGSAGFLRPPSAGDATPASLLSITMTRSKSSDSFNLRPRLRPTSVKSTDTRDLHSFRDTAVNTMKRKLVDAGVGERISTRDECIETTEPYNVLSECSKCNSSNRVQSPSTPTSSPPSPFSSSAPSRIPRLAKPTTPTNSQNGKRPFNRQDTYTKLSVSDIKDDIQNEQNLDIEFRVTPAETKAEFAESNHPESRLTAASASTDEPSEEDDDNIEPPDEEEEHELYSHCMPGGALFQVSKKKSRKKAEPSKEMRGAMKVLSDSLKKSPRSEVPPQLKNAVNIIQQEWFKVSSTATANPLDVEDYLDVFEEISGQLLEHVVNMPDNSGNTAMHYAVSHGNFDVVSILLDSKVCNINQPNQAGYTSVMLVSLAQMRSETDSQVVQRLFQLADVNVRAKQHGQTALMLAASHGRLRMANMLLAAGADVNIQDEDGSTALMCAAEHGHVEMVRLVLSQPDCDVSITDHDGSTALNIAMEAGHRDVGVLLYAHQHFSSRGSSPYSSLKPRRPKS